MASPCAPLHPPPPPGQTSESLVELVRACMWAAGNVAAAARSGEGTATPELCLELLVALALRNRDRVGLLWPLVHEYLAACCAPENGAGGDAGAACRLVLGGPVGWGAGGLPRRSWPGLTHAPRPRMHTRAAVAANPLVDRAVLGLLRVVQRLLPYKQEETAGQLLMSLRLVVGLAPEVAWELAERVAAEVRSRCRPAAGRGVQGWARARRCSPARTNPLAPAQMLMLLKTSGPYIHSEADWRTVCAVLRLASQRPEAAPLAFEALSAACTDRATLSAEAYMPLAETCLQFIDRYKQARRAGRAWLYLPCCLLGHTLPPGHAARGAHHRA